MTQEIDLRQIIQLRFLADALELRHVTGMAAAAVPIPLTHGDSVQRYIATGSKAEIAKLLEVDGGATLPPEEFQVRVDINRTEDGTQKVRISRATLPAGAGADERALFEAWAELTDAQKHGADHDVTGWYYFDEVTQDRWEAWKARAALGQQAVAKERT